MSPDRPSRRTERDSIPAKLDYYLLIHDYAMPAWFCWMTLAVVVMLYTVVSGAFIGEIPNTESAVLPTLMLGWGMFWMLAGAAVGWIPPRF